jgi:glycosyltransferase A (GT-A) superfamily protein (DUF2064 family)
VIGPAVDGGYYLIGFRCDVFSPKAFEKIPWSTKMVFENTMKVLKEGNRMVYTLPPLRDIDTVEDLRIEELVKKGS